MADINTIQTGIRQHSNQDLTKYALFMGGTNVTHDSLMNYDPLIGGFYRVFMVRKPLFLTRNIPEKFNKFKHILEYGNTSVQGINDVTVNTQTYQGGYTGKSFDIPTHATDDTNRFTIQVYEFSGSPVREVLHTWINGTTDLMMGLTHYNGIADPDATEDGNAGKIRALQANHTAEFIYVVTDRTGKSVEYACLIANAFPLSLNNDAFNSTAGTHDIVEVPVEFTATKYESIQINAVAKALLNRHKILANSLNFNSRIVSADGGEDTHYDYSTGQIASGASDYSTQLTPAAPSAFGAYAM